MDRRSVLMAMAGIAGSAALPRVALAAPESGWLKPGERLSLSTGKMVCDGRELWAECCRLSRAGEVAKYPIYGSIGGGEWGPQTGWSVKAHAVSANALQRLWDLTERSGFHYRSVYYEDGGMVYDVRWGDDVIRPYRGPTTWLRMAGGF